jgi:hypothetical protein
MSHCCYSVMRAPSRISLMNPTPPNRYATEYSFVISWGREDKILSIAELLFSRVAVALGG